MVHTHSCARRITTPRGLCPLFLCMKRKKDTDQMDFLGIVEPHKRPRRSTPIELIGVQLTRPHGRPVLPQNRRTRAQLVRSVERANPEWALMHQVQGAVTSRGTPARAVPSTSLAHHEQCDQYKKTPLLPWWIFK